MILACEEPGLDQYRNVSIRLVHISKGTKPNETHNYHSQPPSPVPTAVEAAVIMGSATATIPSVYDRPPATMSVHIPLMLDVTVSDQVGPLVASISKNSRTFQTESGGCSRSGGRSPSPTVPEENMAASRLRSRSGMPGPRDSACTLATVTPGKAFTTATGAPLEKYTWRMKSRVCAP